MWKIIPVLHSSIFYIVIIILMIIFKRKEIDFLRRYILQMLWKKRNIVKMKFTHFFNIQILENVSEFLHEMYLDNSTAFH